MLFRAILLAVLVSTLTGASTAEKSHTSSSAGNKLAAVDSAAACHEWIELHGPEGGKKGRLCHVNVENMESMENAGGGHPAIDLSVSNNESVLLTSTASNFRLNQLQLKDPKAKNVDGQPCPKHPFRRTFNPDDSDADQSAVRVFDNMHLTGVAKKAAIGCEYEMKIKHESGTVSDPHLRIDK